MKKIDFHKWKRLRLQKTELSKLDGRTLLLNVYLTQALTLLLAAGLFWIQGRSLFAAMAIPPGPSPWLWGAGFAAAALAVDAAAARFAPESAIDDGGVNEKLFGSLPLWHIALLALAVAVCEELLFRGAVQHWLGPYWTSILFALLHVRYLRHWLMTGLVFAISYGLGVIAVRTGTLWTPIAAHFLIDFTLGAMIRHRGKERDR